MGKEKSVLETLIEELKENPDGAIELLGAMTNVVRPWESLRNEGQAVMYSFRRVSADGNVVAMIESNAPTWILTVDGERFTGDKVFNTKGASEKAQALVDAELQDRGYVLMEPQA